MASICEGCNAKMKCVYSAPVDTRVTYRAYQCEGCGERRETVEMPVGLFENIGFFDHLTLTKRVAATKAKRAAIRRAMAAQRGDGDG